MERYAMIYQHKKYPLNPLREVGGGGGDGERAACRGGPNRDIRTRMHAFVWDPMVSDIGAETILLDDGSKTYGLFLFNI
eukprot:3290614-Rhodomonas_salina.2